MNTEKQVTVDQAMDEFKSIMSALENGASTGINTNEFADDLKKPISSLKYVANANIDTEWASLYYRKLHFILQSLYRTGIQMEENDEARAFQGLGVVFEGMVEEFYEKCLAVLQQSTSDNTEEGAV